MRYPILIIVLMALSCPFMASAQAPKGSADLERILDSMDRAAASFRNSQADFVWEQFQKVVNETDVQKGTIYFRRQNKEVQMSADVREPDRKQLLFTDGKVRIYQPRIDQVTEYSAGKNRQEFESFLVLGFGGRGHDLLNGFDVSYEGMETIAGQQAARLLLVPKSDRVRGMFQKIFLWIDPARGISLQQQFVEPSGDHRLTKYSNIKMNGNLPDNTFKLQTTGKTKVIRP
ncbi:MAG: outer membrane lipoprotein carrier protein LolA [Candidatus Korobacteraceae bacterium]